MKTHQNEISKGDRNEKPKADKAHEENAKEDKPFVSQPKDAKASKSAAAGLSKSDEKKVEKTQTLKKKKEEYPPAPKPAKHVTKKVVNSVPVPVPKPSKSKKTEAKVNPKLSEKKSKKKGE